MTFRINRVYTRSGDDGKTGLVSGERVSKSDLRVCAYGDVDETNSVLGCVKEELPPGSELLPVVEYLQQGMFDLGGELATPTGAEYPGMWKASEHHVQKLEQLCDRFGDSLPELTSFILPGGSKLAGWFHLARCVARRAERTLVSLMERDPQGFNIHLLRYLNRVSDLLFILARYSLQKDGKDAPLWIQEKDRKLPTDENKS